MSFIETIILGGFTAFSNQKDINKKEPNETFSWMPEDQCLEYEDMRSAFDKVPGARKWMRSLGINDAHDGPFDIAIRAKLAINHRDDSYSSLLGQYRNVLTRWDTWVLDIKTQYAKIHYKEAQIDIHTLGIFMSQVLYGNISINEGIAKHNIVFSDGSKPELVSEVMDITTPILKELLEMQQQENEEFEKRYLAERVHNLK